MTEKYSRIVFQSCLLIEPPLYETKTLPPKTAKRSTKATCKWDLNNTLRGNGIHYWSACFLWVTRKKEINGGGDHIDL